MSAYHRGATVLDPLAFAVVPFEGRVPPMVSVRLTSASNDFLEFTEPGDIEALEEKLAEARRQLEADIIAAAGEPAGEAAEDDGAASADEDDAPESEAGCKE